jgi:DNA/RNA endonuclease YhcR with UshA esterase domain
VLASAQDTNTNPPTRIVSAGAAKYFVGQTNTVFGKVAQVTIREKVVYLNLENPYPDMPCTGVIFAGKTNQFEDLEKLQGRTVLITGKITEYRDQPQIVIENKAQLQVVEEEPFEPPRDDAPNKARPDQ